MLRTTNDHEVAIFSSIHGRGVKIWRAVSMELRIPYFFVSHAIKEDGAWLHETCLLWREADLVEFCKEISLDVNRKIVQLSLLLPATEAGRWNLEELKEIWSESDQYNGCSPIFIANDGRHISQGNRKVPANVTNAKDKIYSIQSANRNPKERHQFPPK